MADSEIRFDISAGSDNSLEKKLAQTERKVEELERRLARMAETADRTAKSLRNVGEAAGAVQSSQVYRTPASDPLPPPSRFASDELARRQRILREEQDRIDRGKQLRQFGHPVPNDLQDRFKAMPSGWDWETRSKLYQSLLFGPPGKVFGPGSPLPTRATETPTTAPAAPNAAKPPAKPDREELLAAAFRQMQGPSGVLPELKSLSSAGQAAANAAKASASQASAAASQTERIAMTINGGLGGPRGDHHIIPNWRGAGGGGIGGGIPFGPSAGGAGGGGPLGAGAAGFSAAEMWGVGIQGAAAGVLALAIGSIVSNLHEHMERQSREVEETLANQDRTSRIFQIQGEVSRNRALDTSAHVLKLASRYGVSAATANQMAERLIGTGIDVREMQEGGALEGLLRAGSAASIFTGQKKVDIPKLTEATVGFMQASGQKINKQSLDQFGRNFFSVYKDSLVELDDFKRLATVTQSLNTAGMGMDEQFAMFAAFRDSSMQPAMAATAMRNIINRMVISGTSQKKTAALHRLGLAPSDVDLHGETAIEALQRIKSATAGKDSTFVKRALVDIFEEREAPYVETLFELIPKMEKYVRAQRKGEGYEQAVKSGSAGIDAERHRTGIEESSRTLARGLPYEIRADAIEEMGRQLKKRGGMLPTPLNDTLIDMNTWGAKLASSWNAPDWMLNAMMGQQFTLEGLLQDRPVSMKTAREDLMRKRGDYSVQDSSRWDELIELQQRQIELMEQQIPTKPLPNRQPAGSDQ